MLRYTLKGLRTLLRQLSFSQDSINMMVHDAVDGVEDVSFIPVPGTQSYSITYDDTDAMFILKPISVRTKIDGRHIN
jgi:hypothetical protein